MSEINVVGLMLAAGRSRRFGADKRQAELAPGTSLLSTSLDVAGACLPELWLVLRPDDTPQALGVPAGIEVVFSAGAEQGMGHSLADGMAALSAQSSADAVVILLGDMPWIAQATFGQLLSLAGADHIVVPTFNGEPGHPVIFGRRFWPELLQVSGDRGGRSVLVANPAAVRKVAVDDPGILRDVDTPAALPR
jgi:molybdenum cofactor cytidylyltransferase